MDNELSTDVVSTEVALANMQDEFGLEVARELQSEAAFLPFMKMVQGENNKLKEPPFDFEDGEFALQRSKTDIPSLGKEVDIMFITWRPLAMNFNGKKPEGTTDRNSEDFKNWRELAEDKNPDTRAGYQWGYEFLVWLPEAGTFATFWFATPSMRRFARFEIIGSKTKKSLQREKLTLFAEKIVDEQEKKTFRYYVCKQRACNSAFPMPDLSELNEVMGRFKEGRIVQDDETVTTTTDVADETIR